MKGYSGERTRSSLMASLETDIVYVLYCMYTK